MGMLDLFREWLLQRTETNRPRRRTDQVGFEELEPRLVLSATLSGTTLTVTGTAGNDTISVTQGSPSLTTIDENGVISNFNTTVNAINVFGGGGNEQITINSVLNTTSLFVDGGPGDSTLISPNQNNQWVITGPNSGTLNGNAFANIENLVGGGFNDDFQFGPSGYVQGFVDGGGGIDTLDYSTRNVGAVVNLQTSSATAIGGHFFNIDNFIGSADNSDTLIGMNSSNVWNITGNSSGNINGQFFFSGVENLKGGTSSDDFVFGIFGIVGGTISGGGGSDTIDYSNLSSAIVTNLQAGTSSQIAVGFNQIGTIIGNSNPTDILIGINQSNVWNITSPNSGTINSVFSSINFQNYQNLTGGTASDRFKFSDGAYVAGVINGGGGADTLDYSPRMTGILINLQTDSATSIGGGFTSIESVVGSQSTSDVLVGLNTPNNFNITGPNSGNVNGNFTFSSIENLTGGNANDSFKFFSTAFVSGVLEGGQGTNTIDYSNRFGFNGSGVVVNLQTSSATSDGGGFLHISNFIGTPKPGGSGLREPDTLIGPNTPNVWTITAQDVGQINGQTTYNSFEKLTGGSGTDVFKFMPGGSVSNTINGGPVPVGATGGEDWLDYSSLITPVTVNLATGVATSVGTVVNVQNVHGSNASTSVPLTTLSQNVATVSTTDFGVASTSALYVGQLLKVDSEFVQITAIHGSSISVLRAQDGTTAALHSAGAGVFSGPLTALSQNITSATTTLFPVFSSTLLFVGDILKVDNEVVKVTAIKGTAVTVLRGQNGTTATVHLAGAGLFPEFENFLTGSKLGNVLLGGQGADNLVAGSGPSVLIGGLGSDNLVGSTGQDILIGGYTDFDNNPTALGTMLAEWQSANSLTTRVNHLRYGGGLNVTNELVADVTVHNDAAVNSITAGSGVDWLWGRPAELKNVSSQDIIDVPLHNNPILTGGDSVTFNVGRYPVAVDRTIQISSNTSATIASATVQIGNNFNSTEDNLGFAPSSATGNIVGSYNNKTGTLTLTSAGATATVAQFQLALSEVSYYNASSLPTTGPRTIYFQVFDGTLYSNSLASTVAINNPPVLSGPSVIDYATLQAPTVVNPNVFASDVDNLTLASATVSISNLYQPNQDVLSFTGNALTGDIVGSFNAATGVLTLTSAGLPATLAQYTEAMRLVTYQDTATFPLTQTRTVSYQVSDGNATSNIVNSQIVFV